MPRAKHGFKSAFTDMLIGIVAAAILSTIGGQIGGLVLLLFSLISLIALLETFNRMEHWSIMYLFGWLAGIALLGPFLLEKWEVQLSLLVAVVYLFVKILRKNR